MNRKNIFGKKILALVTALVMLLATAPVTVLAGGGAGGGEIIAFGLYEAAITMPLGTAEADLPLPDALMATVRLPADGVEAGEPDATLEAETDVPVTWACADYDGNVPGAYTFAAAFGGGYSLAAETAVPEIAVTVEDVADDPPAPAAPAPEEPAEEPAEEPEIAAPAGELLVIHGFEAVTVSSTSFDVGTPVDDVLAEFPNQITATGADGEPVPLDVTWSCTTTGGYQADFPGAYTFEPVIDVDYVLEDGVLLPSVDITLTVPIATFADGDTFVLGDDGDVRDARDFINTYRSQPGTVSIYLNEIIWEMNSDDFWTISGGSNFHLKVYGGTVADPDLRGGLTINHTGIEPLIQVLQGTVTIGGSVTLTGNNNGCAMLENKGTLNIEAGAVLQNHTNTSSIVGGAIYNYGGGTLNMLGTIKNCTAVKGGGIYSTDSTVDMGGSIENCTAADQGGGIYATGGTVVMDGIIVDCTATDSMGGGIYLGASANATVSGTISGCKAANSSGGGICARNTSSVEMSGRIENCTATNGSGGGILLAGAGPTTVSGTIIGCTATSEGGGIYAAGGEAVTVEPTGRIENCEATGDGGGIYLYDMDNDSTTVSGTIIGCTAKTNGGGIYAASKTKLEMSGSIQNCTATSANIGSGGGIYATGLEDEIIIAGSITGCEALYGGGIYWESTDTGAKLIVRANISSNEASSGGGIYMLGGHLDLDGGTNGSIISGNNARSGEGGGIYAKSTATVAIQHSTISGNTAYSGGGIFLFGPGKTNIYSNVTISGNEAVPSVTGGYGGGIAIMEPTGGGDNIINLGCVLSGNVAEKNGGGLYISGGPVENTVEYSISSSAVLSGNTAANGGGLYINSGSDDVTYSYSGSAASNKAIASSIGGGNGGGLYILGGSGEATYNFSGSATSNEATVNGGGLYISGGTGTAAYNFSFNAALSENTAANGGGLYVSGGTGAAAYNFSGSAALSENTAVNGGGLYIDEGTYQAFYLKGSAIISENTATENGGGIYNNGGLLAVQGGAITSNKAKLGGGIYDAGMAQYGTIRMEDGRIAENEADEGGGLYLAAYGADLIGGLITKNSAVTSGGGIYNNNEEGLLIDEGATVQITENTATDGAGIYSKTDMEMLGGEVRDNSASNNGGGIYTNGLVAVEQGLIDGNSAGNNGGGVYINQSSNAYLRLGTTSNEPTISNNSAEQGGGVYNYFTLEIVNCQIINNTATSQGGGIFNAMLMHINDGTVTGNTVQDGGQGAGIYHYLATEDSAFVIEKSEQATIQLDGVYLSSQNAVIDLINYGDIPKLSASDSITIEVHAGWQVGTVVYVARGEYLTEPLTEEEGAAFSIDSEFYRLARSQGYLYIISREYQITYSYHSDDEPYIRSNMPDKYTAGEGVGLVFPLEKNGRPGHWSTTPGGEAVSVIGKDQTGDITLYLNWVNVFHNINYTNLAGYCTGNGDNPLTFIQGDGVARLKPPTGIHPGYRFTGWTENDAKGKAVTSIPASATATVNLYANWRPVSFTVAYHGLEDGQRHTNPTSYTYGTGTPALTDPTPEREGYIFAGWYTAETGGTRVISILPTDTGNINLYAVYVEDNDTRTITYENTKELNNPNPSIIYSFDIPYTLRALSGVANDGTEFDGWRIGSADGYEVTRLTVFEDITLYAAWREREYRVTYQGLRAGEQPNNPAVYRAGVGIAQLNPPNPALRETQQFDGWYTSAAGGTQVTSIPATQRGEVTLWARWAPREFSITYRGNMRGNDISGFPKSFLFGEGIGLIPDIVSDTFQYTFAGWYSHEINGVKVDRIVEGTTNDVVLWAYWTPKQHSITYSGLREDEGTDNSNNPTSYAYREPFYVTNPQKTPENEIVLMWNITIELLDDDGNPTGQNVEFTSEGFGDSTTVLYERIIPLERQLGMNFGNMNFHAEEWEAGSYQMVVIMRDNFRVDDKLVQEYYSFLDGPEFEDIWEGEAYQDKPHVMKKKKEEVESQYVQKKNCWGEWEWVKASIFNPFLHITYAADAPVEEPQEGQETFIVWSREAIMSLDEGDNLITFVYSDNSKEALFVNREEMLAVLDAPEDPSADEARARFNEALTPEEVREQNARIAAFEAEIAAQEQGFPWMLVLLISGAAGIIIAGVVIRIRRKKVSSPKG